MYKNIYQLIVPKMLGSVCHQLRSVLSIIVDNNGPNASHFKILSEPVITSKKSLSIKIVTIT